MTQSAIQGFSNLNVFYGDLHNHCNLSYGHGSIGEAFTNAKLQLDFCSVVLHAAWPDLPTEDPSIKHLVDYHKQGFSKAQTNWPKYLESIKEHHEEGRFISFPSFEWHSMEDGDHCVYYKTLQDAHIINAPNVKQLRQSLQNHCGSSMLIPHHIGYKQGYRGINWQTFSNTLSPVVEIFSFHGQAESCEGSYPYLHTMGPRHGQSTAQYGWAQGHVFGVIGSTDHHNAFPGSYGYGRMAVWAESLTRDAIWRAIQERRTYALTGDRIALKFAINDSPMGSICSASPERNISIGVEAGSTIDYVEVLHNNCVIHQETCFIKPAGKNPRTYKLPIELGWGEKNDETHWDIQIRVKNGELKKIEPRLRGYGPTDYPKTSCFAYHQISQESANQLSFKTKTRPNRSTHAATTEALCLELNAGENTYILLTMNGRYIEIPFADLLSGSRSFYLGGFVSPAVCIHRAVPDTEYQLDLQLTHHHESKTRDWYHVRLRQRNDQWAWTSPIWIGPG